MIVIPEILEKSKLIDWLIENKSALMAQKKANMKEADAVFAPYLFIGSKGDAVKAEAIAADATRIKVRSVINTTKLLDSHEDVHIDQLWNKSLKENKENYLVKQHDFTFEGIVSDNVHAFTKQMSWAELGYAGWSGNTQALIFESIIDKTEGHASATMFDKYRLGKVRNHSVGMRYVEIDLAVKDARYEKEFAVWNKYINDIANKEDAEKLGYFWAVTQAKVIEGSAVVKGSNFVTPTQSVQEAKSTGENHTLPHTEPVKTTQNRTMMSSIDFKGITIN